MDVRKFSFKIDKANEALTYYYLNDLIYKSDVILENPKNVALKIL